MVPEPRSSAAGSASGPRADGPSSRGLQPSPGSTAEGDAGRRSQQSLAFDELFDAEDEDDTPMCGLVGYGVVYFLAIAVWSCAIIFLWSSMFFSAGSSAHPITFLQNNYWMSKVFFGASFVLFISLYLLDFFMPPHLPGQHGVLWDQERVVGRVVLVVAMALFVAGCLFMALYYPNVPMLVSIFLCPGIPFGIRLLTKPKEIHRKISTVIERATLDTKVKVLKALVGQSEDVLNFYRSVAGAFLISAVLLLVAWIVALLLGNVCFQDCEGAPDDVSFDLVFNQAICPLIVALANLIFGLFTLMRVVMHRTYIETDRSRNLLASDLGADPAALEERRIELRRRISQGGDMGTASASDIEHEVSAEYLNHEQKAMKQLTMLVKAVGGGLVALVGLSYGGALLLWADNNIATMFVGLLAVFFVSFVIVTLFTFSRIVGALGTWLLHLPIWAAAMKLLRNDWMRAFLFCLMLPLLFPIALLSMVNQLVRKCRGLAGVVGADGMQPAEVPGTTDDTTGASSTTREVGEQDDFLCAFDQVVKTSELLPDDARRFCLTARFHVAWNMAMQQNLLSIFGKCYMWCILPFVYYVGIPLFNAMFSLLIDLLKTVSFELILVLTFVIGVISFLWPTIPGMVVYMFGGLLITGTCPIPSGDKDTQFWVGAGINVLLGWGLKLAACAVQQKCIGERLGKSVWVRRTCCIHTRQMRTIESVLRKPGLSIGKVAILCGAPDWPVSVLCGILGLSLVQCEIGTLPIIFYVIPCGLCGSMYLKASESATWEKAAGGMVFLTTLITGLLFMVMAWACQREWEQKMEELSRPLRQHSHLFFLDYKDAVQQKRCAVSWSDLPRLIRWGFSLGAMVHILVAHAFWMAYTYLFGDFAVSDPWDSIEWYGNSIDAEYCYTPSGTVLRRYCVFAAAGLAVTIIYLLGWIPFVVQRRYWKRRNAHIVRDLDAEFDNEEFERRWTEQWIKECIEAPTLPTQASTEDASTKVVSSASADQLKNLASEDSLPPVPVPTVRPVQEFQEHVGPDQVYADPEHAEDMDVFVMDPEVQNVNERSLGFCFCCGTPVGGVRFEDFTRIVSDGRRLSFGTSSSNTQQHANEHCH